MKNLATITVILILVTLLQGCRHKTERLEPYGWTLIESKFDSLTRVAEAYMYTPISPDSVEAVVRQMDFIAGTSTENTNELLARSRYWEAYLCNRNWDGFHARQALQEADSLTSDKYLKERIGSLSLTTENFKAYETFRNLLQQLDYYKSIGDIPQQGNTAMLICSNLAYTDAPDIALDYLYMADSLFKASGTEARCINLGTNEATLLCIADRKEEAEKVFNRLFSDSIITNHKDGYEVLLRNHYYFFGDSASLFKGYAVQKDKEHVTTGSQSLTALYESLIADYFLMKGNIDSASFYLNNLKIDVENIEDDDIKSTIYGTYASYYDSIGQKEKAIEAINRYEIIQKEIDKSQSPENKIYTDYLRAKEQIQTEAKAEKNAIQIRLYAIIVVSIILLMSITIIGRKWYQRHRIKYQETLQRVEQRERELMGSALSRQHSEQILDYVDNEITRLGNQNVITGRDIAQLNRNLHLQKLDRKGIQSFEETFTSIHPYFETNLRNIAPDLSDTQVRLCAYIMLGMNNQEIASMLNIKPSSLRQARLRLRQKFGLTKDDSISEFLKQFTPPMLDA